MNVPFVLYRYVTDTRDKQGPKEDGEADLVKNDIYIASLRILLEALDGHFWVAHDRLIGHVVQDGCHVILIHEKVNHRQIVAIIHYEKQDVVESVAEPGSLELKEQNSCGANQSQAPNQYCSYHRKLVVEGTRCFVILIAELTSCSSKVKQDDYGRNKDSDTHTDFGIFNLLSHVYFIIIWAASILKQKESIDYLHTT